MANDMFSLPPNPEPAAAQVCDCDFGVEITR